MRPVLAVLPQPAANVAVAATLASLGSWGIALMRATKFTIWWTENDQRSPWEHRGEELACMPWDGYPWWVLDILGQMRTAPVQMQNQKLIGLPARGRRAAYRGFSTPSRVYRAEWTRQMPGMEDTYV